MTEEDWYKDIFKIKSTKEEYEKLSLEPLLVSDLDLEIEKEKKQFRKERKEFKIKRKKKPIKEKELNIDYLEEELKQERKELEKEEKRILPEEKDIIMIQVKDIRINDSIYIKNLIEQKGCKSLLKSLNNITILTNKFSISPSIIIFGDLILTQEFKNKPPTTKILNVALKTVFKPLNPLMNSLLVEEQIYKNIVSNLINMNHTPHLVEYIGSYDNCKLSLDSLNTEQKKIFENEKKRIEETKEYDVNNAIVIVTKKSSGKTLGSYLKLNKLNDNDKLIIIFQLLYTLLCFNRISLKHNDLHFDNIFIENLKFSHSYTYKLKNHIFTIKTNYSIYIYDYDRGSIYYPSVERNMGLDFIYYEYNELNELNDKMDFQSILGSLIKYNLSKEIDEWIQSIVSKDFYNELLKRDPFPQTKEGNPNISNYDLTPLESSLDKYMKLLKGKSFYSELYQEGKEIYSPPNYFKVILSNPVSDTDHESYSKVKKQQQVGHIDDKFYVRLLDNELKTMNKRLLKLYVDEYSKLRYNIFDNTIRLFKEFYIRKPINSQINDYMRICFMMSLPFYYQFKNHSIKKALFVELFGVELDDLVNIEDDIWNVFQGRLPIELPILRY
jgi:hypothetical protein